MIKEADSSLKIPTTFCSVHQDRSVLSVCLEEQCTYRGMFCYQCIKYHYAHLEKTFEIKEFLNSVSEHINELSFDMLPTTPSVSLKELYRFRFEQLQLNKDNLLRQKDIIAEAISKYVNLAIDLAEKKMQAIESKNPLSEGTQAVQELTRYQEKFFDLANLQSDELYDVLIFFSRFITKTPEDKIEFIRGAPARSITTLPKQVAQSLENELELTCQNLRNSELVLAKLVGILEHLPPDDQQSHQKLTSLKVGQIIPNRRNNQQGASQHQQQQQSQQQQSLQQQQQQSQGQQNNNGNGNTNNFKGNNPNNNFLRGYNNNANNNLSLNNQNININNNTNKNSTNNNTNNSNNINNNNSSNNVYSQIGFEQNNPNEIKKNTNVFNPGNSLIQNAQQAQIKEQQQEMNFSEKKIKEQLSLPYPPQPPLPLSSGGSFLQKFQQKLIENGSNIGINFQATGTDSLSAQKAMNLNSSGGNNNKFKQESTNDEQSQSNDSSNKGKKTKQTSLNTSFQQNSNSEFSSKKMLKTEFQSEQRLELRSIEHFCDALEVNYNDIWCITFKTFCDCSLNGLQHFPIYVYDSTVGSSLEQANIHMILYEGNGVFNKKLYEQIFHIKKTTKNIPIEETNLQNILEKITFNSPTKLKKNTEYTLVMKNKTLEQEDQPNLKQLYILFGDEAENKNDQPNEIVQFLKTMTHNINSTFENSKLLVQDNDSLIDINLTDYFVPYLDFDVPHKQEQIVLQNINNEPIHLKKTPKPLDYDPTNQQQSSSYFNPQSSNNSNINNTLPPIQRGFKDFINNFKNGIGNSSNSSNNKSNSNNSNGSKNKTNNANNNNNNGTNENEFNKNQKQQNQNKRKFQNNSNANNNNSNNSNINNNSNNTFAQNVSQPFNQLNPTHPPQLSFASSNNQFGSLSFSNNPASFSNFDSFNAFNPQKKQKK